MTNQPLPTLLSKAEAAQLCGVSTATFDRLRQEDDFVKPIRIGKQAIRWHRAEVEEWIATRDRLWHYTMSANLDE